MLKYENNQLLSMWVGWSSAEVQQFYLVPGASPDTWSGISFGGYTIPRNYKPKVCLV